jgi:hypothetical protein
LLIPFDTLCRKAHLLDCACLLIDLFGTKEDSPMIRRWLIFLITASLMTLVASANPEEDNYSRLARLSYLEGNVSFQHASDNDWSAASVNFPLQPGDRIYTGPDGRAEIEFDDGSICRLAENTDIELLSLNDDLIQLRIFTGLSTLTVSGNLAYEIDTPAAAFNTLRMGAYRFDVVENGASDAIVRRGELEAANNRFSRRVEPGELLHIEPGENGYDRTSRYDRRDQWDDWTDRREADRSALADARYIPSNVTMGATELSRYGRWVTVDSYGSAWVPLNVDAYWSPYSVGRWAYRPRWGWTWVSYEPWGWLPYHYGRWYHHSTIGWCWIPGPAFAFNFWSPGLVAFYEGPGWVSWCPLGPGDYYNINNYYYNRRNYGVQVVRLQGLHTRAPGDYFNLRTKGAFRTVEIDRFRKDAFEARDRSRWSNVDQPWRIGLPVRDRLNVQPVAASYSANPNRQALRPAHANHSLPAVVRSMPIVTGSNTGTNRDRYLRITNPDIRKTNRTDGTRQRDLRPANNSSVQRENRPQEMQNGQSGNERNSSRWRTQPSDAPARTNSSQVSPSGYAGSSNSRNTGSTAVPRQTAPVPQSASPMRQNSSPMRQNAPQIKQATPSERSSESHANARSQESSHGHASSEKQSSSEDKSSGNGRNRR